jgi:hypothetical protein
MAQSSVSGANRSSGGGGASRSGGGGASANTANRGGGANANTANRGSGNTANTANRGNASGNNVNSGNRTNNVNNSGNRVNNGNVNVGNDVNVNIDGGYNNGCCGGGYGYHPIAAAATIGAIAVTTSAIVGSYYHTLPSGCTTVVQNGATYSQCGSVYYQQTMQGSDPVYVVVNP